MYNNCFGQKNRAGLNILTMPDALIPHHFVPIIKKMTFYYQVENHPKVLMIELVHQKKKLVLTLVKQIQNLPQVYNGDESYLYLNKTEICKFKANNNIIWYNFCLGSVSKDFIKDEQSEFFLNGTVYDISVDHSSIKEEDILDIHQYLMDENNIIQCFSFLKEYLKDY